MNKRNFDVNDAIDYLINVVDNPKECAIIRPKIEERISRDVYFDASENINDIISDSGIVAKVRALPNGYKLKKKLRRSVVNINADATKESLAHFTLMSNYTKMINNIAEEAQKYRPASLLNGKYLHSVYVEPKSLVKRYIDATKSNKDAKTLNLILNELAGIKEDGEKKTEVKNEINRLRDEINALEKEIKATGSSQDKNNLSELFVERNALTKRIFDLKKDPIFTTARHKKFVKNVDGVDKKYDIEYENGAFCIYYLLPKELSPKIEIDGVLYDSYEELRRDPKNYKITTNEIYRSMRNSLSHNHMIYKDGMYTHIGDIYRNYPKDRVTFKMTYSAEWLDLFNEQMLKCDYNLVNIDKQDMYQLNLPTFMNVDKGYHIKDTDTKEDCSNKLTDYLKKISFVSVNIPHDTELILVSKIEKFLNDLSPSSLKKSDLRTVNQKEKYLQKLIYTNYNVDVKIHFNSDKTIDDKILKDWERRISKVPEFDKLSNNEQNGIVKDFILANPEYCFTGENFKIVSNRMVNILNKFLGSYDDENLKEMYSHYLLSVKQKENEKKMTQEIEDYKAQIIEQCGNESTKSEDEMINMALEEMKLPRTRENVRIAKQSMKSVVRQAEQEYLDQYMDEEVPRIKEKYESDTERYKSSLGNKKLKGFVLENADILDTEFVAYLVLFKTYMNTIDNGLTSDANTTENSNEVYNSLKNEYIDDFNATWKKNVGNFTKVKHLLSKMKNGIAHDLISLELSDSDDPLDNIFVIKTGDGSRAPDPLIDGDIKIKVGDLFDFVNNSDMIHYESKHIDEPTR